MKSREIIIGLGMLTLGIIVGSFVVPYIAVPENVLVGTSITSQKENGAIPGNERQYTCNDIYDCPRGQVCLNGHCNVYSLSREDGRDSYLYSDLKTKGVVSSEPAVIGEFLQEKANEIFGNERKSTGLYFCMEEINRDSVNTLSGFLIQTPNTSYPPSFALVDELETFICESL